MDKFRPNTVFVHNIHSLELHQISKKCGALFRNNDKMH